MKLDFLTARRQAPVPTYFDRQAEPAPPTQPFVPREHADVVVIGAGFTGLSAALTLAEAGSVVHVLEAHHIGWGGSGRAWGQVAASAKFMPAKLEQDLAPDIAERLITATATAPDLVFGLVEKHAMICDVVRSGNLIAAHLPSKEAGLAATVRDLQDRGFPVELLEGDACRDVTGSPRFRVALHDRRGGSLNPLGYARGLARAAMGAGAHVHEATPVQALTRENGCWTVSTPEGIMTAETVILATNAFTSNRLFPGIGHEIFPVRAYQLISVPLSKDQLATVLPGRQSLNDTRRLFSGIRIWPDGRLQVGVDGPAFRMDGKACVASADRRIAMTYPQLAGLRWEGGWGGWVDMTADEYPLLHALAPGLWSGFGFSGRGIAIGTIMGRDLAAHVLGCGDAAIHPLSPVRPRAYHPLHRVLIGSLLHWYRVQDFVADRRFPTLGKTQKR